MKLKTVKRGFAVAALFVFLPISHLLQAQTVASILSGTITDSSGKAIANAKISARNAQSGQSAETRSNADGNYSLPNLAPGDYAVAISAEGFADKSANITVAPSSTPTLNLVLAHAELPNAPAGSSTSPSLNDLGFTPGQTQANAQLQATLEKRTEMLKIHQRLGLITTIPIAAAVITGPYAKAKGKNGQTIKEPTTANLDFHAALGGAATGLYFTTAYFAIWAPRVSGTTKHGAIRMHEALAFIHGPGMILTPVLGIMAYKQENAGEKVHGIASAHGTVAYVTAAAYGASIVAVSWPIHLKFWEKK